MGLNNLKERIPEELFLEIFCWVCWELQKMLIIDDTFFPKELGPHIPGYIRYFSFSLLVPTF